VITGGAGNDRLAGMGGSNVLDGGAGGTDTADYSAAPGSVSLNLFGSAGSNGFGGTDRLLNIENIIGGSGDDVLVGDGNDNVLTGGAGRDALLGGAGNDTFIGGAGAANEIYGGAGNDLYIVSAGDTLIENEGEGTDTVQTTLNFFALGANIENLTFTGTGGFFGIGNGSDNTIRGGGGNDSIDGGGGNDVYLLSGLQGEYTFEALPDGSFRVTDHAPGLNGDDGADILNHVERVRFSDGTERALVAGVGSSAHADSIAPISPVGFADGRRAEDGAHVPPCLGPIMPTLWHELPHVV
jgi:Ca2+-binding RTX toxin-like protein